jgi:hypothetical protein
MNICIYGYYKIDIHSRQSVRVAFDDFEQWEEDCTIKRNGTELIDIIKSQLESAWFQDITFNGDEIIISYFNPMTGEGSDYSYKITPISEDGEE